MDLSLKVPSCRIPLSVTSQGLQQVCSLRWSEVTIGFFIFPFPTKKKKNFLAPGGEERSRQGKVVYIGEGAKRDGEHEGQK